MSLLHSTAELGALGHSVLPRSLSAPILHFFGPRRDALPHQAADVFPSPPRREERFALEARPSDIGALPMRQHQLLITSSLVSRCALQSVAPCCSRSAPTSSRSRRRCPRLRPSRWRELRRARTLPARITRASMPIV